LTIDAKLDLRELRVRTAEAFAAAMNESGIRYVLVNGLYGYPNEVGRDLDILIRRKDAAQAILIAQEIRDRLEWDSLLLRWSPYDTWQLFFIRKDDDLLSWLEVDLMHEGTMLMGVAPLIHNFDDAVCSADSRLGPFQVSKIGYYMKAQLRPIFYGDLDRFATKYSLEQVDDPEIESYLRGLLGDHRAAEMITATHKGIEGVRGMGTKLKWAMNRRFALRHPWGFLRNLVWARILRPWRLYWYSSGLVFAVVSPGGSTEAEVMDEAVRYFNGCFHVRRKKFVAAPGDVSECRTEGVSAASFPAYWRFCSWFFSLNLAYYLKDRFLPKSVIQFVLYDRSPGEMSVIPWRYRLSDVLGKLLRRATPIPNEIILLPEENLADLSFPADSSKAAHAWSLVASREGLPIIRRAQDGAVSGKDLAKLIVGKLERIYVVPGQFRLKSPRGRMSTAQIDDVGRTATKPKPVLSGWRSATLLLIGFVALWLFFFWCYQTSPILSSASNLVRYSIKEQVLSGKAFPPDFHGSTLAIFGTSKAMAGFVPDEFDKLASQDSHSVYSFNSGEPGSREGDFVTPLETMAEHGRPPDIILLTYPWESVSKNFSVFKLKQDDNEIADTVFPFRLLARNAMRFVVNSRRFGGPANLYRQGLRTGAEVVQARGYYFIKELSVYPTEQMPSDYTLASDQPDKVLVRKADPDSKELDRLNHLVTKYKMQCFYVPLYFRTHEAAPPPPTDLEFAATLAKHSGCHVLGPDYMLYPPAFFSDPIHLNQHGAQIYTADLYRLLEPYLNKER
jgi:hypothetical protein